ncbi:MAG: AlkA N-terminal domain-containing protein, partial [Candidatus Binatia bacterium]
MEHLDPARCYRICAAHDGRFDGRFFVGVVTTGIYCRPVCRVRLPKLENCRFFACAAAAEAAGFRACLRCRPETSPGTPAWLGTSATVSRALRLIADGALDDATEERLAERLGVGARHLRRLFAEHLGATPAAVARTRRVHFARRLITESPLSMTEIAFASGFRSLRQFNGSIRSSFRASPTELRRRWRARRADGDGILFRLACRPPFDWCSLLSFLRQRAIPGVEVVDDGAYRRTIEADGSTGTIEVRGMATEPALLLRVRLPSAGGLFEVVERVRRLFDLAADPLPIVEHLGSDPRLARVLADHPGIRLPGAWDGFELAIRAVLGQQVTVKGATTLCGRLVRAFGTPLPEPDGALTHLFPRPDVLAGADLSRIGVPRSRSETVRALARAVAAGDLSFRPGASLEETIARLVAIPGVGPWTAHYVAMRAFGETDAFPASDLGVRR